MTVISVSSSQSANSLLTTAKIAATVSAVASQQQATLAQSTSVSIGQVASSSPVYTITKPLLVWENVSNDLITSKIAGNLGNSASDGGFSGLGAALLQRFTQSGGNYSQSVFQQTSASQTDAATSLATLTRQSQLHGTAENQVSLSIKTASGALVDITMGSDNDGLAVQVKVSKGTLSDTERAALAKLADGFQKAIDGLTTEPPKLDLSGLTQFDTSVLSSVDLHANFGTASTLDFHADSNSRTVKSTGAAGTVAINVDMSKRATLGSESQQKQAMTQYLKQFDSAGNRGNGDANLMTMFKDAFTALNSNTGPSASTQKSSGSTPIYFSLNGTDKNMLTGLADFTASVTQTTNSNANPMRPGEVDAFSYQVSQTSSITGSSTQDRNITQKQQAHLVASYHKPLAADLQLNLTSDKNSQNYLYYQVDDKSESSTAIQYHKGLLVSAAVEQSASTSTRIQKYVQGILQSDTTTPVTAAKSTDLLGKLQSAWQNDKSGMSFQAYLSQHTLPDLSSLVLLQSDPNQLAQAS